MSDDHGMDELEYLASQLWAHKVKHDPSTLVKALADMLAESPPPQTYNGIPIPIPRPMIT